MSAELSDNPFPGPSAYRHTDQRFFFGRKEETEELTSFVLSSSVTLLYAPSGTGKSSLLQAGVLPHLADRFGVSVLPIVRMRPTTRVDAPEADNEFVRTVCDAIGADGGDPVSNIAAAALRQRGDASALVVLVLDQFEEVFADPSRWSQRDEFFLVLKRTLAEHPWLRAIIALRSDYLAELVPHEQNLPDHLAVRYQLEPLGRESAANAVVAAFAATDVELGDADVERVMDLLLRDPLNPSRRFQYVNAIQLQILCRQLWFERSHRESPVSAVFDEKTSFTLERAIVQFVDGAINTVVRDGHIDELSVRWWLGHRLLTPTGRRAFLQVGDELTAELPNAVVTALAEAKLLQVEHRHGARLTELTHDSMADAVTKSNDSWLRRRNRRRLLGAAALFALFAVLIALFPSLRQTTKKALVDKTDVISADASVEVPFQATDTATAISFNVGANDLQVTLTVEANRGVEIGRRVFGSSEAGSGEETTSLVVETIPENTYKIMMRGKGKGRSRYNLVAHALPLAKVTNDEMVGVSSSEVAVPIQAGVPQVLTADNASLRMTVEGVRVLASDTHWAVVQGVDPAPLAYVWLMDSTTGGEAGATTIRRRVLPHAVPLEPGTPTDVTVHDAAPLSYHVANGNLPFGVEANCNGRAQLLSDEPGRRLNLDSALGTAPAVIPLSSVPGTHRLILGAKGSPPGAVTCRLTVRSFDQPPLGAIGSQIMVLPNGATATAYTVRPAEDSALVSDAWPDAVSIDFQCPRESGTLVASTRTKRLLAFVPKNTACTLWLSRDKGVNSELRIGLRTSPATIPAGG